MRQKGQPTTLEERVKIAELASRGKSSREIANELGRPITTIRKWRHRYKRYGRVGLSSQIGRPATGALGQSAAEIREAILQMRGAHPGWGPQTLRLELAKDKRFAGTVLPSRPRIAAFLKEKKKVRKYDRHQDLPGPPAQLLYRPHQEWEMDAQGETTVDGLGKVSVINLLDPYSHLSIDSHACLHVSRPRSTEYQCVLRRAFIRYGLPEQISLDHDSAFFDNKSASPFPSVIHLWLIGMGVQVRFIQKRPPLEHSRIERHHQTIAGQAFTGQTFPDIAALQHSLQSRILFLNSVFPTRALGQQTPLQFSPQAVYSGRFYSPAAEEQILDMQRIYEYLQIGSWFRQVSSKCSFKLGGYSYNAPACLAEHAIEITFDGPTRKLTCLSDMGTVSFQLDIHGLTKSVLMGNTALLPGYIPYQLALPFACPDTTS